MRLGRSDRLENFCNMLIKKRVFCGFSGLVLVLALAGCDQWAALTEKKPQDVLQAVSQKMSAGQFKEARQEAEPYAAKEGSLRPEFALAVARAAARTGDVDAALAHLTVAIRGLGLSAADLMADPAFSALQSNVRFLALITDTAATTGVQTVTTQTTVTTQQTLGTASAPQPRPKKVPEGVVVDSGGGASVKMNRQGTEVRAGDITIRLPN